MEISLTPDQEAFIRQAVASGPYPSTENAVRDALARWEEDERARLELLASSMKPNSIWKRVAIPTTRKPPYPSWAATVKWLLRGIVTSVLLEAGSANRRDRIGPRIGPSVRSQLVLDHDRLLYNE
jgi:putative addiction module CopG family antidote